MRLDLHEKGNASQQTFALEFIESFICSWMICDSCQSKVSTRQLTGQNDHQIYLFLNLLTYTAVGSAKYGQLIA